MARFILDGGPDHIIALLQLHWGSLFRVLATFENESRRIKGLPLIPIPDDSIIQEADRYRDLPAPFNRAPWDTMLNEIIQFPNTLAKIGLVDFLDDRVWACYSDLINCYIDIDASFDELKRLLTENPEFSVRLSVSFAELQSAFQKMKEARQTYDAVYKEMSKYRADNSVPGNE
jgi:hypothetical protein